MIRDISAWLKVCLGRPRLRRPARRATSGRSATERRSSLCVETLEPRAVFAAGDLDPTFGSGGVVTLSGYEWSDQAFDANGKVVSVGTHSGGSSRDVVVARFQLDGTLDASFGGDGIVTFDLAGGSNDAGVAVAIDSQGRIVVGGTTGVGAARDFVSLRLTASGALDETFGLGGVLVVDVAGGDDDLRSVGIDAAGRVVLSGTVHAADSSSSSDMAAVRLTAAGSLDASFSADGKLVVDFAPGAVDRANAMALDSQGRIVLAGGSNADQFALARIDVDGTLDATYDGDGLVTIGGDGLAREAFAIAIDAQGRAVIAGRSAHNRVHRVNVDGGVDSTFSLSGTGGVSAPTPTTFREIAFAPDGKIVVAGAGGRNYYGHEVLVVGRLRPNGLSDTSVDIDGALEVNASGGAEIPLALRVESNGRILVTGTTVNSAPTLQTNHSTTFSPSRFVAARVNANGTLDASFDGDGKLAAYLGEAGLIVTGSAVQRDGKIVVVGSLEGDFFVRRYNVDGSIDLGFGLGGARRLNVDGDKKNAATSVAIDPQGRILIAGNANEDAAVVRLNGDGSTDYTFGVDGIARREIGLLATASAVLIGGDGAVTVVGHANVQGDPRRDVFAMRLTSHGAFEDGFGDHGLSQFQAARGGFATGAALDAFGRVVIVGVTPESADEDRDAVILRVTHAGTLDPTFGDDGVVLLDPGAGASDWGGAVAVDPHGRIVVAGSTGPLGGATREAIVVRVDDDGVIDGTFGVGGIARADLGSSRERLYAVAFDAAGRILVAGESNEDLAVARLTAGGALDTAFGDSGRQVIPYRDTLDFALDLATDADGRVVVTGVARGGGQIVRLQSEPGVLQLVGGQLRVGAAAGSAAGDLSVSGAADGHYSFTLLDDASGRFVLDGATVRVATALEATDQGEHVVRVRATGPDDSVIERDFTLVVASARTPLPPAAARDADVLANAVDVGAVGGAYTGLTVRAAAPEERSVTYSLTDDAGGRFAIDAVTGVVRVRVGATIDAAPTGSYTVTVRATAGGDHADADFTISAVLPSSWTPVDVDAAANRVLPGSTSGPVGVKLLATSPFGEYVTYRLSDDAGGMFQLQGDRIVVLKNIPYNGPSSYTVEVAATAGTISTTAEFVIEVPPNAPPSAPYDTDATPNSVIEGTTRGTPVGIRLGSADQSRAGLIYRLVDDAGGRFRIDYNYISTTWVERSGEVGVTTYHIAVVAVDGAGLQSEPTEFTIVLANAPPFESIDVDPTINRVREDAAPGTPVGVTARSDDYTNDRVTYSLVREWSDTFQIDPETGVVSVRAGARLDVDVCDEFEITVAASDGEGVTLTRFSIALIDAPPSAPVDLAADANRIFEGHQGAFAGIRVGSKDYAPGDARYELLDDAGGRFVLVGSYVYLKAGTSLNFETATSHTILVRAVDGDGRTSDASAFTIDVVNSPPGSLQDVDEAQNVVPHDVAAGASVGVTLLALDDGGGPIVYSLTNDAGGRFAVDATTGVVVVADGAAPLAPGEYIIAARASDGSAESSRSFRVTVLPPPVIDVNGAENVVVEQAKGGTLVGVTAAPAIRYGGTPRYSIVPEPNGTRPPFRIDPATGVVSVAPDDWVNYEERGGKYVVKIRVEDAGVISEGDIEIRVINVAPYAPEDGDRTANKVVEGAGEGSPLSLTVSAGDPGGYARMTYSLSDDAGGRFQINPTTGQVTVAADANLNAAVDKSFVIAVRAFDGELYSPEARFTIEVVRTPPEFRGDLDPADNVVTEGAAPGTLVGITAVAGDVPGTAVKYSISQNYKGWFAIDPDTGVVSVAPKANVDYSGYVEFDIYVKASDGKLSSESRYSIFLVNAAPTAPVDADDAPNTIAEGAKAGTKVGVAVVAADPAGGKVTYSLVNNPGGKFAINSKGVITLAKGATIDFEEAASYTVTVAASDGRLSTTADFTIDVVDLPPLTPTDADAAADFVAENALAGTIVGVTARATDVAGGVPSYSLTNDAGGRFTIDAVTGVVTVSDGAVIDFESDGGYYVITVQASAGSSSSTADFVVRIGHPIATAFLAEDPAEPGLTSLYVYGTDGKDSIKLTLVNGVYEVVINKSKLAQTFAPSGRIYVFGAAGDDAIDVGATTTHAATIDGGLGRDSLHGGLGDDVLLGRDGDDSLAGRGGRDLLVGGAGADKLTGAGTGSTSAREGNLLIGDATEYDADVVALAAIAAAWSADDRVSVASALDSSRIHRDGEADALTGSSLGIDWALAFELTPKGTRLDKLKLQIDDLVN